MSHPLSPTSPLSSPDLAVEAKLLNTSNAAPSPSSRPRIFQVCRWAARILFLSLFLFFLFLLQRRYRYARLAPRYRSFPISPALLSTFFPPANLSVPVSGPPSPAALQSFVARVRAIKDLAAAEQTNGSYASLRPHKITPGLAVAVDPNLAASRRFKLSMLPSDPLLLPDLARVPYCARGTALPVSLRVMRNVYISHNGIAIDPHRGLAHELGGGCCLNDWEWNPERNLRLSAQDLDTYASGNRDVFVVLAQHHGETYHHALFEPLPRYLMLRIALEVLPHAKVVIDDSDLIEKLLVLVGLDSARIVRVGTHLPSRFAAVALYPPPKFQDKSQRFYPRDCLERAVALLLKSIVLKQPVPGQVAMINALSDIPFSDGSPDDRDAAMARIPPRTRRGTAKPVIILLERALSRSATGCRENRCIRNFDELRKALAVQFEARYELVVHPADASTVEAISIFDSASIVVGVHGGGFQNLMFCRPGTDVVHIGWGLHYQSTAYTFGLWYHLFQIDITRNSKNIKVDAGAIVRVVEEIAQRRGDL